MPNADPPPGTIRTLQALRGAACLMVVLYHTLQAMAGERAIARWPNLSAGVDLFFVLSGVVVAATLRGAASGLPAARRFLWRRAARILPLYWFVTTIKLAITAAAPALTPHTLPSPGLVLASFCLVPARDGAGQIRPVLPVGWSLEFEAAFYVLAALALAAGRRVTSILPLLALAALAGFWRAPAWPAPLSLANGLCLEFGAGLLLGGAMRRLPGWAARHAGVLAALAFLLLLTLPLAGPWRFLVWGGPAAAIVAAGLALEPRLGPRLPPWLLAAGDASYATYLLHPLVVPALAHLGLGALAPPLSLAAGQALHATVDQPVQALLRGRMRVRLWPA